MSRYVSHPRVLQQIQTDPSALQLFNLRGVVCHSGATVSSGHYTAKCFSNTSGIWYDFNDAHVRSTDKIQSPDNYIFFYEMTPSTKAFWPK
jgi:ubiquitin C-terminal hydrolase